MKRRPIAFKLLLFLLAGAIINVLVAWGCAAFHMRNSVVEVILCQFDAESRRSMSYGCVPVRAADGSLSLPVFGELVDESSEFKTLGFRYVFTATHTSGSVRTIYSGWPMHSCGRTDSVIDYNRPEPPKFILFEPLWPGFAINTIFYAAILYALFAVPGAVRRRVRIKRGQCASCGYSLCDNTSDKCPECGITASGDSANSH